MDDGNDDENGNFEGLSSYAHLVSLMRCRKVSYYKVIKDYDKNDFWGPLSSMALNYLIKAIVHRNTQGCR